MISLIPCVGANTVRRVNLLIASAIFLMSTNIALSSKRVALVIGNGTYKHTAVLANPRNDASDIQVVLEKLGFVVIYGNDLDKAGMVRLVRDFADALTGAEVGAFFYAGHGLQVDGVNYLVPTDARLLTPQSLSIEMMRLDDIQRVMEASTQTNVVFLDACRDNPLVRSLARSLGTRSTSIGKGLAHSQAGLGTLISYATQPGNVAMDGEGTRNSPYTEALKAHLGVAGVDLTTVLIEVRNHVIAATGGKQIPWDQSALKARLYFNPTKSPKAIEISAAQTWAAYHSSESVAVLEAFANRYGETEYAALARVRIEKLKQRQDDILSQNDRIWIQKKLAALGYNAGIADGVLGPASTAAIESFQRDAQLPASGKADRRLIASLNKAEKSGRPATVVGQIKDCAGCPAMVKLVGGRAVIGAPTENQALQIGTPPLRRQTVTIKTGLAISKHEVTVAQFEAYLEAANREPDGGCHVGRGLDERLDPSASLRSPGFPQTSDNPVVCVSYKDAESYVRWLSAQTSKRYRLPTEEEWEYAARGGVLTNYPWGNEHSQLKQTGNCKTCNSQWQGRSTAPVGLFPANLFGLRDMHGNAAEWVDSCTDKNQPSCAMRVVRGGAWADIHTWITSHSRDVLDSEKRSNSVGFRVVRTSR